MEAAVVVFEPKRAALAAALSASVHTTGMPKRSARLAFSMERGSVAVTGTGVGADTCAGFGVGLAADGAGAGVDALVGLIAGAVAGGFATIGAATATGAGAGAGAEAGAGAGAVVTGVGAVISILDCSYTMC